MTSEDARLALEPVIDWAVGLRWNKLPVDVQQRARCVLLDDVGAMFAGSVEPEAQALRNVLADGGDDATVFCEGLPRRGRHSAAEINGFAGSCLELDEGYRQAPCHAGLYSLPAVLAASEWRDVAVAQCVEALLVGYEFATRCARAWRFDPGTVHPHGAFAAVASAAGTSKLLGHSKSEFKQAVASAATLAFASPFNHATGGALVRNLWPGSGSRLGMLAAELAPHGIGGLPSAPADVFSGLLGGHPHMVSDSPHERPAILDAFHKLYACCQYLHSGVDALLAIRESTRDRDWPREISVITVWAHRGALDLTDRHPDTTLGAKFSMPHALAAAAALGTGCVEAFDHWALRNKAVVALRERVHMEALDERATTSSERAARVQVRFADGHTEEHFCRVAPGEPGRTLHADELLDKFVKFKVTARQWTPTHAGAVGRALLQGSTDQRVRDLHMQFGQGRTA